MHWQGWNSYWKMSKIDIILYHQIMNLLIYWCIFYHDIQLWMVIISDSVFVSKYILFLIKADCQQSIDLFFHVDIFICNYARWRRVKQEKWLVVSPPPSFNSGPIICISECHFLTFFFLFSCHLLFSPAIYQTITCFH